MNKDDLISKVASSIGVSKSEATKSVDAVWNGRIIWTRRMSTSENGRNFCVLILVFVFIIIPPLS